MAWLRWLLKQAGTKFVLEIEWQQEAAAALRWWAQQHEPKLDPAWPDAAGKHF